MREPYSSVHLPELRGRHGRMRELHSRVLAGPPLYVFNLRFVAGKPYSRVRFPERRDRAGRISEQ
jgi:hypothetical protein